MASDPRPEPTDGVGGWRAWARDHLSLAGLRAQPAPVKAATVAGGVLILVALVLGFLRRDSYVSVEAIVHAVELELAAPLDADPARPGQRLLAAGVRVCRIDWTGVGPDRAEGGGAGAEVRLHAAEGFELPVFVRGSGWLHIERSRRDRVAISTTGPEATGASGLPEIVSELPFLPASRVRARGLTLPDPWRGVRAPASLPAACAPGDASGAEALFAAARTGPPVALRSRGVSSRMRLTLAMPSAPPTRSVVVVDPRDLDGPGAQRTLQLPLPAGDALVTGERLLFLDDAWQAAPALLEAPLEIREVILWDRRPGALERWIETGRVVFPDGERAPLELRSHSLLRLEAQDRFLLRRLALGERGLLLELDGVARVLRFGAREPTDVLPTWLLWIYTRDEWVWLIGTVGGIAIALLTLWAAAVSGDGESRDHRGEEATRTGVQPARDAGPAPEAPPAAPAGSTTKLAAERPAPPLHEDRRDGTWACLVRVRRSLRPRRRE